MGVVPAGRIVGLDAARCLALIGMIATHVLDGLSGNEVTLVQQLAGGRASALFAVLAGVSMALMSGGTTPVTGGDRRAVSAGLAGRALFIAAIGLALGELDTDVAVILTYYGMLFLLGLPFLGLRARALATLAVVWVVVTPLLSHLARPHLPERALGGPVVDALADPVGLLVDLTVTGYYPALPWLAYLLAGMAIGRLDLRRAGVACMLIVTGAAVAAVSWLSSDALLARSDVRETLEAGFIGPGWTGSLETTLQSGLFGTTPTSSWWWLAVRAPHTATPFDLAQTIGSAMFVIGLCLLVGGLVPRLTAVLFGAGAMTLTLYTVHVVLRTNGLLSGSDGQTFAKHVLVVVGIGAAFRLVRQRGPLEVVAATIARRLADAVVTRRNRSVSTW